MDMSHTATCLTTLQKVEDISPFLATRNATFCCRCRLQNWGVTSEIFLATCFTLLNGKQHQIYKCFQVKLPIRLFKCLLTKIKEGEISSAKVYGRVWILVLVCHHSSINGSVT